MPLTVGSLFAGIGGLELGLEQTGGFKTIWSVEIDEYCNRVRKRHWPAVPQYLDVREFPPDGIERPDLICGGSPCQDLSVAGKRAGLAGERSGLFHEFTRIVGALQPRWVIWENVGGALSSHGGRDFLAVLNAFHAIGYDAEWCHLHASDFGLPHRRRRVFVVAYPKGGYAGHHEPVGERRPAAEPEYQCDELADPTSQRCGQGGSEPARQQRASSASGESDELANAIGKRGRCETSRAKNAENAWVSGQRTKLAYPRRELPQRERATGPEALPDRRGGGATMADTDAGNRVGQQPDTKRCEKQGTAIDGTGAESLGDAAGNGPKKCGPHKRPKAINERHPELFAPPGPGDRERWDAILTEAPWLAPALERGFCRMADGLPPLLDLPGLEIQVDDERRKRLKALGNAVVPACARWVGERILEAEQCRY